MTNILGAYFDLVVVLAPLALAQTEAVRAGDAGRSEKIAELIERLQSLTADVKALT